jgi:hypothetical protein
MAVATQPIAFRKQLVQFAEPIERLASDVAERADHSS